MNRLKWIGLLGFVLLASFVPSAWAAHITDVKGTVVDMLNNDKPIPNARVTYTNLKTGKSYTTVTDEKGRYLLKKIQTGKYRIEAVNANGEKIFTIENREVEEQWAGPPPSADPMGNHRGVQDSH